MKRPEISYRPIGNSGPLSIYWHPGPYGDAIECKKGNGVAWLSPTGEPLGVEYDDVNVDNDHQALILPDDTKIEVFVKRGKVRVKTHFKNVVH